jgi:hypothetical protein
MLKGFFRERVATAATCLKRLLSASGALAVRQLSAAPSPAASVRDRVVKRRSASNLEWPKAAPQHRFEGWRSLFLRSRKLLRTCL